MLLWTLSWLFEGNARLSLESNRIRSCQERSTGWARFVVTRALVLTDFVFSGHDHFGAEYLHLSSIGTEQLNFVVIVYV